MALYEKSDGILETHVKWEDIEEEMRKVFGENARFGENKKATCISDMKGFMSRIALIDPDWIDSQSDLPKQVVVKISSQLAFLAMIQMFDLKGEMYSEETIKHMEQVTKSFHNREVGAYELLIDQKNKNIPFTKIYGMRKFDETNQSKGFIISEYIPDIFPVALYESVPADDLIPVIKAAAQFSALGEKVPENQLEFAQGNDILSIVFAQFNNDSWKQNVYETLRETLPDEYKDQVEGLISLTGKYYMNPQILPKYKEVFSAYKSVLTHSDLWSGNILFTNSGNRLELAAIIDFQTCSFSSAALDLGRCFSACLSSKDRRERGVELINIYYETFVEALDGRPAPYDLQQLKDSYELYFPLAFSLILPGMAPCLKLSNIPDKENETMRTNAVEKTIGLMEDVLKTHSIIFEKLPNLYDF